MKTFYFVSGLPRSGSTLLCNILLQNSYIHATHTSGCLDTLFGLRNNWHSLLEHQAHPDNDSLKRVLRAALEAYHSTDLTTIVDKSRGWISQVEFIEAILDRKVKILVPVRSLSEVIASMERLHRKTQEVKSPPGENSHFFQMQTLEGRIDYWLRQDSVVGLALNRIQDVIARGLRDRIHFIDFDVLTTNPAQVMSSVYDFLGEVPFPHDFTNVEQKTSEDDTIFGYVGLHKIRPAVTPVPKYAPFILGKQLTARLNGINVPWQ